MASLKVLITDFVHPDLRLRLKNAAYDIDYLPDLSYNQFLAIISNYQGFIINSKIKMNAHAISKTKDCVFIGRLGSGLDIIDLPVAKRAGISVFSAPEGNRNAVAEHAVGMLLGLLNNLHAAHSSVKEFRWDREINRGVEIEGKTIGIIGFGNTGKAFAEKWAGWNARVLVYDKYKTDYTSGYAHIEEVDLDYLLEESDVVSLHLQLTDETKQMVDNQFLAKMKTGAILINTSRGGIVNTSSLIKALKSRKLSGACLDVLEQERFDRLTNDQKISYKSLFSMKNVVLSPHIAGWSIQSLQKIANVLEFSSSSLDTPACVYGSCFALLEVKLI